MKQERQVAVETCADYYEKVVREGLSLSGYEADKLFVNRGKLEFVDASFASGLDSTLDGRGTGIADFDGDGDTDILQAMTKDDRILYFRNDTPSTNHFVRVRLDGAAPNTSAIGAVVKVRFAGRVTMQEVRCGSSYLAQSSPELVFGLESATTVDEIQVTWPGPQRVTQKFSNPSVDSLLWIKQGAPQPEIRKLQPRNFNRDNVPSKQ